MITYSHHLLNELIKLCKEYEVLTIADEALTGFGRTGELFASQGTDIDIICLAKGLTGGFLTLGVTACSEHIFEAFLGSDLKQAFLHGHSYTANPIACVAAQANLTLLLDKACTNQRETIAIAHQEFCRQWKGHPKLKRCESIGIILILEYFGEASYFSSLRNQLYGFFISKGILLRPLGNVLYVLPPYCIQKAELETIYRAIEHILNMG